MSLECIAAAAWWHFEFLQHAGLAAAQAVLQMGAAAAALWLALGRMCLSEHWAVSHGFCAETVKGSTPAVLPTSSKLFQLTHFPLGTVVKEAAALWLSLKYVL